MGSKQKIEAKDTDMTVFPLRLENTYIHLPETGSQNCFEEWFVRYSLLEMFSLTTDSK